jgi:hypothetical protein
MVAILIHMVVAAEQDKQVELNKVTEQLEMAEMV